MMDHGGLFVSPPQKLFLFLLFHLVIGLGAVCYTIVFWDFRLSAFAIHSGPIFSKFYFYRTSIKPARFIHTTSSLLSENFYYRVANCCHKYTSNLTASVKINGAK